MGFSRDSLGMRAGARTRAENSWAWVIPWVPTIALASCQGPATPTDMVDEQTSSAASSAGADDVGVDSSGAMMTTSGGPGGTTGGSLNTSGDESGGSSGSDPTGGDGEVCSVDAPPVTCTIYVATDGADGADGTSDDPLRRVSEALEMAVPGDTICLRTGEYPQVRFRKSGSEGAPITVRNEPGHTPVIVTHNEGSASGVLIQNSMGEEFEIGWLVVSGLEITDCFSGILTYSAHDIVIEGNYIHDNVNQGINGAGARVKINANVIADNGGTESSLRHGIYMQGSDFLISNNLFTGNSAYGIQVAGYPLTPETVANETYAGATEWRIVNNTFTGQHTRTGIVLWQAGTEGVLVANNVFWRNCDGSGCGNAVDELGSSGGHIFRNNVFDSDSVVEDLQDSTDENNMNVDAMLDAADGYRLMDGSPAIGAGSLVDAPSHDLEYRVRDPARNDAGALHYCP